MQSWAAYRRNRGSLNPMLRADRAAARQIKAYLDTLPRKSARPTPLFDLIPFENDPAQEEELTFERAGELFG